MNQMSVAFLLSLSAVQAVAKPQADACTAEAEDALWDNELARRVYSDRDQFMALYERYYDRILNFLYRRTLNLDEAQDLTSRTFLQAFEALCTREHRVAFRPWLYRIATNLHTSQVRRAIRWAVRVGEVGFRELRRAVRTPNEAALANEDATRVRNALQRLPEKYHLPLILRFDEEMGYAEIAAILHLTESGTRSRVARGLHLLEREMRGEKP